LWELFKFGGYIILERLAAAFQKHNRAAIYTVISE
jgi:hypothetical protein